MIRFYDKEVFCIEYDNLNRSELRSFFMKGNQEEIVCVLKQGDYEGYITWPSLLGNDDIHEGIQREYAVLDETVWENGRQYFARHQTVFGEVVLLPILDREGQLVCFAYQDEEASRELRMLRELEECGDALTFCDLNPEYTGATIHGFNEIAYYMAKYLTGLGIAVNVEGELWKEFGPWESHAIMAYENYEIWAEGVWQKSENIQHERLRSVSVEFECVDKIYEANIKAGKITDAEGNLDALLEKLSNKKEIIIVGTDTESEDAYDLLLGKGIDICAFLTGNRVEKERKLFGKPVLEKTEVLEQFDDAVFIECRSQYSAWGFGEVDRYDYEGYRRNVRYFLLRDYTEVTGNNLQHVLQGKNILFVGDADLCSRVWRWQKQYQTRTGRMGYWDILEENEAEIVKLQISGIKREDVEGYDVVALVTPEYHSVSEISKMAMEKRGKYIEALKRYGIFDYTDYFSSVSKLIELEMIEETKIRKELRPLGVLIGAIPPFSGNILIRQCLAGHPQILMIEGYFFLNNNLYSICIRLAEKKASDILPDFWRLYQGEAGEEAGEKNFPDREKFDQKMEKMLECGERFTSQELFIMFHIAYEAMYGREISDLKNIVIYWEPHNWNRNIVKKWSWWLGSSGLKGFVLRTVRNRYTSVGSAIKRSTEKIMLWNAMGAMLPDETVEEIYSGWEERIIRFEDIKKEPRETLTALCEWLHIAFDEIVMKTTVHGQKAFCGDVTGFDLRPVYNLYEKYFTSFDRMRICLLHSIFQKKYGYPYVNPLDFSRRELQELFLKEFRWEKISENLGRKDEGSALIMQKLFRNRLWEMRFSEIMNADGLFIS